MKKILVSLVVIMFASVNLPLKAQAQKVDDCDFFDSVVNNHNQIFESSCIPSTVEMVLKYCKVVGSDFYDLQQDWKNKIDGSFLNFDKTELYGVTFSHQFGLPRDANFPMDSLFQTIESELKAGRKVIISIPSDMGWHMFVVHKQTADGEFVSYSKQASHTLILRNTKEIVRKVNGTDIMTYSVRKKD